MKNICTILLIIFFHPSIPFAQSIISEKQIDSTNIKLVRENDGNLKVLSYTTNGKVDTIWVLPVGYTFERIIDAKFFKDKFYMIYQMYPSIIYHTRKWNGNTWETINSEHITWFDIYSKYNVEIIGEGKVILNLDIEHVMIARNANSMNEKAKVSSTHTFIFYDIETGLELNRTVEKQ
jgi:hypothetical protein